MISAPFRILSLDGGGIRGVFGAALLEHVETYSGKSIAEHFDLITGTSTGAIIALGLASNRPAADILGFYREHGPTIFSERSPFKGWLRPRYRNTKLVEALRSILGDDTLNDLAVPVCIPSYELSEGCPRVFKDNHHADLHWGGDQPLWKIAAASSAAPTYFPAFQIGIADSHIDGGIWANNPVLVGIAEAVKYFEQPLESLSILSIATGSSPMRLPYSQARAMGLIGWAHRGRIIDVVFQAQSQSADGIARMLLPPERYLRIDANCAAPIPLDKYGRAEPLLERGAQAGRKYMLEIQKRFLGQPAWRPVEG